MTTELSYLLYTAILTGVLWIPAAIRLVTFAIEVLRKGDMSAPIMDAMRPIPALQRSPASGLG